MEPSRIELLNGAVRHDVAVTAFGRRRVQRERARRRWTAPWPGVLVETARSGDWVTLASAAVLLVDHADAVLTGPTAANLQGLTSLSPTPIHLQVPYGLRIRSRKGLRIHNGPLVDADRGSVADLPVLGLERVVTDLLCTATPPDALAIADEALARLAAADRDGFRADIARRLRARPDPRGTGRGLHLLDLATGRAASPAESRLLWQVVDSGFPIPEVNFSVTDLDGREIYRIDLAWAGLRIALEYYGYAAHIGRSAQDEARAEDLRRRGWIVVVVWLEDTTSTDRYQADLDDAFRRRGLDTSRRQLRVMSGRRHREPWLKQA